MVLSTMILKFKMSPKDRCELEWVGGGSFTYQASGPGMAGPVNLASRVKIS